VLGALNDQLKKLGGESAEALEEAAKQGLKSATEAVVGAEKEAGGVTDKVKGLFEKKE
jgi:hypothetical protein